jgi:hypothetical protein
MAEKDPIAADPARLTPDPSPITLESATSATPSDDDEALRWEIQRIWWKDNF